MQTITPPTSVAHPEFLRIARDASTDPIRLSRALDIVAAGQVERLPSGQWSVPSQSAAGGYVVSPDGRTCDCPDYRRRETACKHGLAVRILLADERADAEATDPTRPTITVLPQRLSAAALAAEAELFPDDAA